MTRWKLCVVVVALSVDLTPLLAMVSQSDLAGVQWHLQKPSEQTWSNEHQARPEHVQDSSGNKKDQPSQFEAGLIEAFHAMIDQEKAAEKQRHADGESWDSPPVLAQLGLLAVTLGYTIFAFFQLKAIRQTLIETGKSADAATKGAGVAESALQLTERAYLTFEEWRFDNPDADKRGIMLSGVTAHLLNTGRTPATLVGFYGKMWETIPSDLDYKALLDREWRNIVIPQQGRCSLPILLPAGFTTIDYRNMMGSRRKYYVFAYVEYVDKFEKRRETAALVETVFENNVGKVFKIVPAPDYNYAT